MDGGAAKVVASLSPTYLFFFAEALAGFALSLVVFANERTQRKPIYERGWF